MFGKKVVTILPNLQPQLLIGQQFFNLIGKLIGLNLETAFRLDQEFTDRPEVLHVRAEQNRHLHQSSIEHVVPADRDQTAADKNDIGAGVKFEHFTESVADDHLTAFYFP